MANVAYPKDLSHPNGFRTVTVFSDDEEKAAQVAFAEFRQENDEAYRKALSGEKITPKRVRIGADKENGNG